MEGEQPRRDLVKIYTFLHASPIAEATQHVLGLGLFSAFVK